MNFFTSSVMATRPIDSPFYELFDGGFIFEIGPLVTEIWPKTLFIWVFPCIKYWVEAAVYIIKTANV